MGPYRVQRQDLVRAMLFSMGHKSWCWMWVGLSYLLVSKVIRSCQSEIRNQRCAKKRQDSVWFWDPDFKTWLDLHQRGARLAWIKCWHYSLGLGWPSSMKLPRLDEAARLEDCTTYINISRKPNNTALTHLLRWWQTLSLHTTHHILKLAENPAFRGETHEATRHRTGSARLRSAPLCLSSSRFSVMRTQHEKRWAPKEHNMTRDRVKSFNKVSWSLHLKF